jgi:hypothetical protein
VGRTTPTYVQLVSTIAAEWSKFRRVLRRPDQLQFDRLIQSVRYYAPSGSFQCSDDPRESIVLSILLDLQTRLSAVEGRLKMPELNIPPAKPLELFTAESAPVPTGDVGEPTETT